MPSADGQNGCMSEKRMFYYMYSRILIRYVDDKWTVLIIMTSLRPTLLNSINRYDRLKVTKLIIITYFANYVNRCDPLWKPILIFMTYSGTTILIILPYFTIWSNSR